MKKFSYVLADLALVAAAIAAAMGMVMIGLWIAGYPAGRVRAQWWIGAVGSHFAFIVATKNACPLILTGLAAGIAFRSGVFNIGAEGQSILGAIATVWIATRLCPQINSMAVAIPLALLGAMLFGGLWGMIAGALERWRGVPIVLSTILLNFIALQLLSLLLEGPLKTGRTAVVQSDALPTAYWLPILTHFGDLRSGVLIALTAAALAWLLQARTAFGFELLVTGLNPTAAKLRRNACRPSPTRRHGPLRSPRWSRRARFKSWASKVISSEPPPPPTDTPASPLPSSDASIPSASSSPPSSSPSSTRAPPTSKSPNTNSPTKPPTSSKA